MTTCAVCLEPCAENTHTLSCGHVFHTDCIVKNLRHGNTACPTCRDDPYRRVPEATITITSAEGHEYTSNVTNGNLEEAIRESITRLRRHHRTIQARRNRIARRVPHIGKLRLQMKSSEAAVRQATRQSLSVKKKAMKSYERAIRPSLRKVAQETQKLRRAATAFCSAADQT